MNALSGSRKGFLPAVLIALGSMSWPSVHSHAAVLYFRPGGVTSATAGSTYDWDTATGSWYSAATGGTGTTWTNSSTAAVIGTGNTAGYTINLLQNVNVAGFTTTGNILSGNGVTVSATASRTLTFDSGASVAVGWGTNRSLIFGNNIALSGNFGITGGYVRLAGATFDDTVTISGGRLQIGNSDSANYLTGAKVNLAGGGLYLNTSGTARIVELSGSSGTISRETAGSAGTLVVDQNTNTTFSGTISGSGFAFQKEGAGILVVETVASDAAGAKRVNDGSLYVRSNLYGAVTVAAGANLGGTATSAGLVTLSGAASQLTPGLFDTANNEQLAGTLTLAGGLAATSGATFTFALNGDDDGDILNSRIVLTGGTLNLGTSTTKTINFLDLEGGHIEAGVAYLLLDANAATRSAGWDTGWVAGTLPTEWVVDEFTFDSGRAYVTFASVPEPSTAAALAAGMALLGATAFRRRSRRS